MIKSLKVEVEVEVEAAAAACLFFRFPIFLTSKFETSVYFCRFCIHFAEFQLRKDFMFIH